jgi:hypothetical protein
MAAALNRTPARISGPAAGTLIGSRFIAGAERGGRLNGRVPDAVIGPGTVAASLDVASTISTFVRISWGDGV